MQPFAQEQKIGNNLHRREKRESKSEKKLGPILCRRCLARSVALASAYWREVGPASNCGTEGGEAMEAREAKEAIVEAGTTPNSSRRDIEVYFGGN